MKRLPYIVSEKYLQAPIFVALMGTAFTSFFMLQKDVYNYQSIILIFLSYFNGYLYTKYQYKQFLFSKILIINSVSFVIGAIIILNSYSLETLFKWLIIIILGIIYNSSILRLNIRKIPLIKIFFVGLCWALVSTWLFFPTTQWNFFIISWLYITALIIPFDIRDNKEDKIITLPKLIGVQNSKIVAHLFFITVCIISFYTLEKFAFGAILVSSAASMILTHFSNEHKSPIYFSLLMESCSGLPLLLWWLIKWLY